MNTRAACGRSQQDELDALSLSVALEALLLDALTLSVALEQLVAWVGEVPTEVPSPGRGPDPPLQPSSWRASIAGAA